MPRVSSLYSVYDHKAKQYILQGAIRTDVVDKIGIPYEKVSLYAANGYKFNRIYSIKQECRVLDDLISELSIVLMDIKSKIGDERFKHMRFTRSPKRKAAV